MASLGLPPPAPLGVVAVLGSRVAFEPVMLLASLEGGGFFSRGGGGACLMSHETQKKIFANKLAGWGFKLWGGVLWSSSPPPSPSLACPTIPAQSLILSTREPCLCHLASFPCFVLLGGQPIPVIGPSPTPSTAKPMVASTARNSGGCPMEPPARAHNHARRCTAAAHQLRLP